MRPREEYNAGHIPGARSIPLTNSPTTCRPTPNHDVVAYCRGAYCVLAHDAVRLLAEHGRSAARLADGMLEWRLANLPIESAA